MLCSGHEPTTGSRDEKLILCGDSSHLDVRIWPSLCMQRSVKIIVAGDIDRQYGCHSALLLRGRDQLRASLRVGLCQGQSQVITVTGWSMTGVARDFFEQVLREDTMDVAEDGHGTAHAMASIDWANDLYLLSLRTWREN